MTIGVILVNLGTPNSFQNSDVKRYLHQFLLDKWVIDKPWLFRQLLVRGLIVPKRYKESAHSYKQIWDERGSPLKYYGESLVSYLQKELEDAHVELAMRYQNPSIKSALQSLKNKNIREIIVFPLFPQYASATVHSIYEEVMKHLSIFPYVPAIRFVPHFFDKAFYLDSICSIAKTYPLLDYDHILFSFHGLPKRQLKKIYPGCCTPHNHCCLNIDSHNYHCYSAQCYATARSLIEKLGIKNGSYTVCFQSRLGKDPWIEPSTVDTIRALAEAGKKKLLVLSPSFVCDCLETLYEIGVEYRLLFESMGGSKLDLVRGLNDDPVWKQNFSMELKQYLSQAVCS